MSQCVETTMFDIRRCKSKLGFNLHSSLHSPEKHARRFRPSDEALLTQQSDAKKPLSNKLSALHSKHTEKTRMLHVFKFKRIKRAIVHI